MELSIFEVLGPVMIGPSSSHTAGVARLAKVAAVIAHKPFGRVRFGLSGSLAKTRRGHGTDKALLAGVLGLAADDERIRAVETLPGAQSLAVEYADETIENAHENSVHFTFFHTDGTQSDIWGSSLGGGRIRVFRIGEYETAVEADKPTLVVHHIDRPGVVSEVAGALSDAGINIALMQLSRTAKGERASAVIVTDSPIPPRLAAQVRGMPHVTEVIVVDVP